ncbi:hypothetical protein GOY17_01785 [Lysobacter soli]|uniref:hypothetical protein n=1 Tax=Lysobacter soli TaxID=453783 RepID=UPI0012ED74AF|nr:hypothetical protein [Lysobacter soli]QGW63757.1 hypothetical protein GOY17_01785 [Lysobacter soli]
MAVMIHGNVLVLAMLLVAGAAGAHSGQGQDLRLSNKTFMQLDAVVITSKDKPNELQRVFGLKSYLRGDGEDAVDHFMTAARYADKYSQHYLSLMYWHGAGVAEDRAQAYVWADLAAERGSRTLLLIREKMWSQLTPSEQAHALALGGDFYARYGDEVAKPRAEGLMRAFARDMTGSRLGYRSQPLDIVSQPVNGAFATKVGANVAAYHVADVVTPDQLYDRTGGVNFDVYWKEQDALLDGIGSTAVGPVSPVKRTK